MVLVVPFDTATAAAATGGKSAGIDARANRWDAQEYEELKQQRED